MCTHCESTFENVPSNEDGSAAIEDRCCARPECEVYLCRAGGEHLSFECEGCGQRFCTDHKINLDGLLYCLECVVDLVESQAPDCECRQTDVDLFDPLGCQFHDPSSAWNVRLRAVKTIQEYETQKGDGKMGWSNGKDNSAGASVVAPAQALELAKAAPVVPDSKKSITFAKAVKYAAKGRVALVGPAGSGKSYTMLLLARALAGPTGRIAAIDTEHGALSKYADVFDFDVIELDTFSPETYITTLHSAEEAGYDVFCCDSLSHFWMGRDGALEFVDMATKRNRGDSMNGWREFRPHERLMVDEMISSPCHVICTMRTKTDFQEQTVDGKKKRVKIGLAPVQREGLEFEFDLVGYMDEENTLIVDKTRCSAYTQKAYTKPGPKEFEPLVKWLAGGPSRGVPVAQIDTGGYPPNTRGAAQYVAEQKIAAGNPHQIVPWKNMGQLAKAFDAMREAVGAGVAQNRAMARP